jgi:hypothetical protein
MLDQSIGQHGDYAFGWRATRDSGPADLRIIVRAAAVKGGAMTAEETRPDQLPDDWHPPWLYLQAVAESYARSLEIVGGRLTGYGS